MARSGNLRDIINNVSGQTDTTYTTSEQNKRGIVKENIYRKRFGRTPVRTPRTDQRGNIIYDRSGNPRLETTSYAVTERDPQLSVKIKTKTKKDGTVKTKVRRPGKIFGTVYRERMNPETGEMEYKKKDQSRSSIGFNKKTSSIFGTGYEIDSTYGANQPPNTLPGKIAKGVFGTLGAIPGLLSFGLLQNPFDAAVGLVEGTAENLQKNPYTTDERNKFDRTRFTEGNLDRRRNEELQREVAKKNENLALKISDRNEKNRVMNLRDDFEDGGGADMSFDDAMTVVKNYPSLGSEASVIYGKKYAQGGTDSLNDKELEQTHALRLLDYTNGDKNALTDGEQSAHKTKLNKQKGYITPKGEVAHINLLPKKLRDKWQAKIDEKVAAMDESKLQTMSKEEYMSEIPKQTNKESIKDFLDWKDSYGIPMSKWSVGQKVYGNKVIVGIRNEEDDDGRISRKKGTYVFADFSDVVTTEKTYDEAFEEARKKGVGTKFKFNGVEHVVEFDPDYVDTGAGQRTETTTTGTRFSEDVGGAIR